MRKYYLIIDTETGMDSSIIDIAGAIYTRESILEGGNPKRLKLVNSFAAILNENWGRVELFHDDTSGEFGIQNLKRRNTTYKEMLHDGRRVLSSVGGVNRWLNNALLAYPNISLTAYNLAFDIDKMQKQGIDITGFRDRFCLWHGALGNICDTKSYKNFALENHYFTSRTKKTGHMGIKTSAETVSHFITGLDIIEPHTALEDVTGHEMPILEKIINTRNWQEKSRPYVWKDWAIRNHFTGI